jgi:hypothetical protein
LYRSNPLLWIDQVRSFIRSNPLSWIGQHVFVKSAPSNCKVVFSTSRRSRLHQVKSHNPSATSQLVFICEDGVLFEHTHHTSSAVIKKCVSLGGNANAAKCDVKERFWSIS